MLLPIPDEAPVIMIVLPSRRFPIAVDMVCFEILEIERVRKSNGFETSKEWNRK